MEEWRLYCHAYQGELNVDVLRSNIMNCVRADMWEHIHLPTGLLVSSVFWPSEQLEYGIKT
jgi:hypothetical protein